MLVFYLLIAAICVWGLSLRPASDSGYLCREQGDAVKGIFILIVFLSHATRELIKRGYEFTAAGDQAFFFIQDKIGQLCVVMFLFFSGYGVMRSMMEKGDAYVRRMPVHRVLGTLVNFDIAVVVFAVVLLLAGRSFTIPTYLLALTGWESLGNSNWYIFVILLCYLCSWVAASVVYVSRMDIRWVPVICLLLVGVVYVVLFFTRDVYWYNTILVFPLGMAFCFIKPQLDGVKPWQWWALLVGCLAVLAATYHRHQDPLQLVHTIRSLAFALLIVVLLRRFRVGNPLLVWLGQNLFPLYVYQMLPILLLPAYNAGIYVIACFTMTCLIVPVYNRFLRVRL